MNSLLVVKSVRATLSGDADGKLAGMLKGSFARQPAGGGADTDSAAGTSSPSAPSYAAGPPVATRNAPAVKNDQQSLANRSAAAPMMVANIGGQSAPAPPSVTMMMPIPIPIRPRTEDMVLRAIQSVNYV